MATNTLTHNRHVKSINRNDFLLLLLAMVLGSIGILILKLQFFPIPEIDSSWNSFTPSIWAIFILLTYALLVNSSGSSQIEPETIGDNCYYLGFLFTLVSLALTLYQLVDTPKNADLLRNIVSGFGIALCSTIVGIALRVLFFQQRTDIVARDRENQREVQKAVREFRIALSDSTIRLKQFTIESVQLAGERDNHIRESTEKALSLQISNVSKLTKELESVIEELSSSILKNSETFDKKINEVMTQSFFKLTDEIRNSLSENTKLVFLELEKSADKLKDSLDKLSQVEETNSTFMKIQGAVDQLENSTKKLKVSFDEISQNEDFKQAFSDTQGSVNQLMLELIKFKQGFEGFTNIPETIARAVSEMEKRLNQYQSVANSNSQNFNNEIDNMIQLQKDGMSKVLGVFQNNSEKIDKFFSTTISKFEQSIPVFDEIEQSASRLKKSMDDLSKENGANSTFSELEASVSRLNKEIGNFSTRLNGILNGYNSLNSQGSIGS